MDGDLFSEGKLVELPCMKVVDMYVLGGGGVTTIIKKFFKKKKI